MSMTFEVSLVETHSVAHVRGMDFKSCSYPIKADKASRSVEMIVLAVITASTGRQRAVDVHLSHSPQRSTVVKQD